ncbi:MAG: sialate O-acetylesterase [Eubacteriales bacterium]|nr:sialate O-acetylesterase [Eubacteriales bacterium]
MIRLSSLISDGMVLQRNVKNRIWGYGVPGRTIELFFKSFTAKYEIGKDRYFEFELPEEPAGGPWGMLLCDGEDSVVIRDILFGDVFLLGGQSNMELPIERVMERYGDEILQTSEDEIRMFEVPKEYVFGGKRQELEKGFWTKARGEELQLFSAAGYFAAKELHDREGIPVGLLQTAVGGTPVKAWCSEETIVRLGYDTEEIAECRQKGYPEKTIKAEEERDLLWRREALTMDAGGEETEKGSFRVPGFFEGTELEHVYGGVRFAKTITLAQEDEPEKGEALLYLGAIVDADMVWVNGKQIGETPYRYPPRIYRIPEGILHAGENVIEVKVLIFGEGGGFVPGKAYELCYGKNKEKKAVLAGEWDYEIIHRMEELPQMTFFQFKACGLYQGMLYPIRKWKIKGCFFYQGESNTGRPETYEEEFRAMIEEWRELWEMPEMPVIFVQLAGFSDGKLHTEGTNWAVLREAQRKTAEMPHTMMVQAYDLGEYNDLHPTDKKTVGIRAALAAEKMIYGREVFCQNPELTEMVRSGNHVQLTFGPSCIVLHTEKRTPDLKEVPGICLKEEGASVRGFEIVHRDGSRTAAEGRLTGARTVEIAMPEDADGISYAWNDCPWEANLYSAEELPAVPFTVAVHSEGTGSIRF